MYDQSVSLSLLKEYRRYSANHGNIFSIHSHSHLSATLLLVRQFTRHTVLSSSKKLHTLTVKSTICVCVCVFFSPPSLVMKTSGSIHAALSNRSHGGEGTRGVYEISFNVINILNPPVARGGCATIPRAIVARIRFEFPRFNLPDSY